jgi:RNA polymerase-interacting CarD/CdnL/TRCF family regulator
LVRGARKLILGTKEQGVITKVTEQKGIMALRAALDHGRRVAPNHWSDAFANARRMGSSAAVTTAEVTRELAALPTFNRATLSRTHRLS